MLAADPSLQMFRVAGALHCDRCERALDLAQITRRQFDSSRADVLLKAMQLRRARNRNNRWLARQQPGESDLCGHRSPAGGDLAKQIDQGLVRLPRLPREARHDVAEIRAVELRALVDRAGEKSLAQRTERDEADPK